MSSLTNCLPQKQFSFYTYSRPVHPFATKNKTFQILFNTIPTSPGAEFYQYKYDAIAKYYHI